MGVCVSIYQEKMVFIDSLTFIYFKQSTNYFVYNKSQTNKISFYGMEQVWSNIYNENNDKNFIHKFLYI